MPDLIKGIARACPTEPEARAAIALRFPRAVTIGAGAVVVKDVEPGVTVAGNPAHVISRKEPGRLIYRKWSRTLNLNK